MMIIFSLINLIAFGFIFASAASAHCPLCVAGAGVGLTLSRFVGVDDSITGIWMAAFLGATSFYFTSFTLRKIRFPFKKFLVYLAIFVSTIWSFYQFNLVNAHNGYLFGLPKLTFGLILGGIIFYLVDIVDAIVIKRHQGVYFPYQRVIVTLGSVWILSLITYIMVNYYA
jgi:hypothetical protein